jgi:L-rhamnose mutarotase
MNRKMKRYCKTMELKKNPKLIREYKKLHEAGSAWPEVTLGMRQVGILDMEIYISGTSLFMIMDTVPGFDHDRAMSKLSKMPRQAEWEAAVSRYQKTKAGAAANDKWKVMERIFKLGE